MPTDKMNDGVFIIEGKEIPMDEVVEIGTPNLYAKPYEGGEVTINVKPDKKLEIKLNWMIVKTYFKLGFKGIGQIIKLIFRRGETE